MVLAVGHTHPMRHRANHPGPDGLAEAELDSSIRRSPGEQRAWWAGVGALLAWEGPEITDDVGGGLI